VLDHYLITELLQLAMFVCLGVTVSYGLSVAGAGMSIQPQAVIRSGSGSIGIEETLPAAKAGTLSTRTDDNTGVLTLSSGHGITDGQIVDVYWSGGVRYGMTVGTVAGTSVPIDLGAGDNLPLVTTAITDVVHTSINVSIDGHNAKIVAIEIATNDKSLRTAAQLQLRDASNDEIAQIDLVTNVPQVWDIEGGSANPFTGDPITNAKASQANASTNEVFTLRIIGVQDASP